MEVLEDRLALSTLTVLNTNEVGLGSLRQVIGSASSGDTIVFSSQIAGQTITLTAQYGPIKLGVDGFGNPNGVTNLTVDGQNMNITVSGGNTTNLFEIAAGNDTFNNLTFANGQANLGGAILVDSGATLNLNIDHFNNNNTTSNGLSGGAIESDGTLNVEYCNFTNNSARLEGGAIHSSSTQGTLSVVASSFDGNGAGTRGGAIDSTNSFSVSNSYFNGNEAPSMGAYGGAIFASGAATLSGNTFTGNTSGGTGGAVYASNTLNSTNDSFSNNSSTGSGGAISVTDNTTLTGDTFQSNTSAAYSGAVDAQGATPGTTSLKVYTSTFTNNNNNSGGGSAIFTNDVTDIETSTFTGNGNSASGYGGAINYTIINQNSPATPFDSSLLVNQDTFSGNGAEKGGALSTQVEVNAGTISVGVTNSTFAGNQAVGSAFNQDGTGGAVNVNHTTSGTGSASATFVNDTFFQNYAYLSAGALFVGLNNSGTGTNTLNLTSNTVYQNRSVTTTGGVVLGATDAGSVTLDNNIFSGNVVTQQGFNGPLDFTLAPLTNVNVIGKEQYNLVGTASVGQIFTSKTDQITDFPGLADSLAANGANPGYPQTLALSPMSAGYEAGDPGLAGQPNPFGIDARGHVRQIGKVSIGAEDPDAI